MPPVAEAIAFLNLTMQILSAVQIPSCVCRSGGQVVCCAASGGATATASIALLLVVKWVTVGTCGVEQHAAG
jgi:hypothetical protein